MIIHAIKIFLQTLITGHESCSFSFIRNAVLYDYPIVESIRSLLPLVDEYVIAVGKSEDNTRGLIESIQSNKIKFLIPFGTSL